MAYDLNEPLAVESFRDALWKGLGRTVLFVQRYGDEQYRDAIFHACTVDLRHDRQSTQDHADLLFDVIRAARAPEWYVSHLIDALPTMDPEHTDPWQAIAILRRCAEQGDGRAREAVIDAFLRNVEQGGLDCLDELLLVEGAAGFIRAARLLPLDSIPEDDRWRIWSAVCDWEHRDGEEPIRDLIRNLHSESAAADQWVEYLEREWREIEGRRQAARRGRPVQSYEEFVDFLDSRVQRGRDSVLTYGFHPMRRVTEETVNRLALDLLNETYPLRRLALMRAFRHRPFPKGHMWLMPYVQSDDEAVREAAIRALAQITHGDIRELALRGATSDMRADLVAELLVRNVRQGDEPLLLELARRDLNQDIYHWMGIDVRRILQGNPALDSRAICLELYERGPCSMCRYSVVELLRCTGALPDWIRAELPFDAYRSTRELAAQNQPL